jgi:hypothetical protein
MANTITLSGLTEIMYQARDIVAAEPCAFLNSVLVNSSGIERVSLGGTVNSFKTAQPTLNTSYTAAMTIPDGDDQTITAETLTVGQVANVKIPFKGETLRQIENTAGREAVKNDMFAQAFRKIRNTIEAHIGTVVKNGSSRATGTAGTTPFASNHNSVNAIRQILVDNGCPVEDGMVSLVMSTTAGTNLRNLSNLYKVNENGSGDLLRRGVLQDISGIMLKESAGVASHTKGTLGGSPTITNANFGIGETSLTLSSAGTGTIVAGDALSIANDTSNVYIVKTGDADVSDGGTVVLNAPGLRKATGASTRALTVAADYTANVAFHKSAVELVMRPPAMPEGGDAAAERMTIADDKTGLVYEVALYLGYGMNMLDITVFYQAKVWKPEFVGTLLG